MPIEQNAPRAAAKQLDKDAFGFGYNLPTELKYRRGVTKLVRSDILIATVQIFTEGGGEHSLHSHDALDGFWFVLSGRARFYGLDDEVIAEPTRHEGVFLPRNTAYWFECVGEEPLEILQVEAIDLATPNKVRFLRPGKRYSIQHFDREGQPEGEVTIEPAEEYDSNL
jgi:mannose-6-phosphate isomerase-like protein (cupin superfamily)